jgi:hypothetical protein
MLIAINSVKNLETASNTNKYYQNPRNPFKLHTFDGKVDLNATLQN